jgi:uncharacterized protein YndB with AHSA1/START domain
MSTIRRQVSVAATPRAVWTALTTPEGLATWLGIDARVDPRSGGRIVLKVRGTQGTPVEEAGFLHVFRPTAKFEVNWDKSSPGPWKGTFTQFQVARDGKETVLNVQHSGPGLDDVAIHAEIDGIWKRALLVLRDGLEAS